MKFGYNKVLPIFAHRQEIVEAIVKNEVIVIVGETGSGKSTQIPKMILEALIEIEKVDPIEAEIKIAHTQPRRIAATSIAMRIAEEMDVKLSAEVGYKIRFDDESTRGTIITLCTDGILLQEMKGDNLLSRYNAVLVDEAHERNLNIDFLLGLLKNIYIRRQKAGLKPLKIVITSATFDAQKFANFFIDLNGSKNVPVINVSGRLYPVNIKYLSLKYGENLYYRIADLVKNISQSKKCGDILIFMPGEAEIFSTIRAIDYWNLEGIKCLPLYSRLSMDDQRLIYQDFKNLRKIVVATNIAETSLTVPGIKYVIDPGVARITDFNFRTGIGSLEVKVISQAAAVQRAGRAGRVEEGDCIRLFSKEDFESRAKYTVPEIQRSDLASVVLHMILIGIRDVYNFEFIDPPDVKAFGGAFRTLHELGAVSRENELTDLGLKMAHLPLEPKISSMLLAAEKYNTVKQVSVIASSLSVKDPFLRPNGEEEEADLAKRYFQILARGDKTHKIIKIRKGRKIVRKRVTTRNAESVLNWTSDLLTFLVVWNKFLELNTEEEKIVFCEKNYLNILVLQDVEQIYHQLIETLYLFAGREFEKYLHKDSDNLKMDLINREGIVKAIATGLIQNLLEYDGRISYRSKNSEHIFIHPGSALFGFNPKWVVSAEIVETTKLYARNNTVVDPAWFEEIAPQLCNYKYRNIFYDRVVGKVMCEEDVLFRGHRIIKGRLTEAHDDDYEALRLFIKEALVYRQAGSQFDFVKANQIVKDKIALYYLKSGLTKLNLNNDKLVEWYVDRFSELKVNIKSVENLYKYINEYGETDLRMKLENFLNKKEQNKIDNNYPDNIYLFGQKLEVRYFRNHFRFPDGAAISLTYNDLVKLNNQRLVKLFGKYEDFHPNLLICSDNNFSAPIAMGKNLDKIKEDYDNWHLRKQWKIAKRKYQIMEIRPVEIWGYWDRVMEKIEIGTSLFFGVGKLTVVFGWLGMYFDGKKYSLLLYENEKIALRITMDSLRKIFQEMSGAQFYFFEDEIQKLEEKYHRFFDNIDMKDRLEELLWKNIALEKAFGQKNKFKNGTDLRELLKQKVGQLPKYKQKVYGWLEQKLNYLETLNANKKRIDKYELMELKEQIEKERINDDI